MIPDEVPATCPYDGCQWDQRRPNQASADRALATHLQRAHAINPLTGIQQMPAVEWHERAVDGAKILASRGEDFTLWQLHELGIPDPPNARYALGRFAQVIHDLGIAHPVGYQKSQRPGTKASSVRVWNADRSRCTECLVKGRSA